MRRRLGPLLLGVHRPCLAVDDVVVDAVLDIRAAVGDPEDALRVGFIFREQQRHVPCTGEVAFAQSGIAGLDDAHPRGASDLVQPRPVGLALPGPLVAEPQRRQDVHLGRFRTAVVDGDLDQDILRGRLGVLDEHVKVAVLVEHAGIDQLILEVLPAPAPVGLDQVVVGVGRLRILVEVLHIRMGRRAVEVEVILLDILAMVGFAVGQPEQAFLEDRILAIPQGQREAQALVVIANAGQTILAPAIGARAGLIVGEVIPGVTTVAVVLAHRAPLALAQVRSPLLPGNLLLSSLCKSNLFCTHRTPLSSSLG